MKADDARSVIRRMVEAFNTGETSSVTSFVADSYRDHQGLSGTEVSGPSGFRHVVEVARRGLHGLRVSIEDLVADGDRVAVRLRWVGTRPSDGVIIERETIDIVRCELGRAVEHWGARTWMMPF